MEKTSKEIFQPVFERFQFCGLSFDQHFSFECFLLNAVDQDSRDDSGHNSHVWLKEFYKQNENKGRMKYIYPVSFRAPHQPSMSQRTL